MRVGSSVGYSDLMQLGARISSLAASGLVLLALSALARDASAAEEGRVLVIGGGPSFRDAVAVALNPWKLQVLPADLPAPRGVMPRAAHEARALGQRFNVVGVVWVSAEEREYALFIYDAKTEQIVSRALDRGPPFDGPTAASHALSVKSLLRASTVAPPEERIGAPPQEATHGAGASQEPSGSAGRETPPPRDSIDRAASASPPFEAPFLRAELTGGARIVADSPDARLAAGVSLWPDARRRFGIGLEAHVGPGL